MGGHFMFARQLLLSRSSDNLTSAIIGKSGEQM
jgi:hypothetical protein